VVDNHYLQLFTAYVLLWSPKSLIPCPVITTGARWPRGV